LSREPCALHERQWSWQAAGTARLDKNGVRLRNGGRETPALHVVEEML
jgi:hypothetical protein